ncbi:phosphate starvation protein PhoH [Vulcanisaeta souniana JCM 11219]|uniref:Phosphate starvation protein PhoH n=1 Tax=Vulcanisaeta souniana JCM 11219 TaxID=1293586 RepID=A0A830E035_9CREN|nr:phosphate starvation protein PhoH [Vulcanisaeta souniana JCM 11219]GGI69359.1 phosphate starvation protein PhoH [Vulcanisaeta souniana JCM 11219]
MPSLLDKIKPMSIGQERFLNALKDSRNEIVGAFGPTGTGKSLISCIYGISSVLAGTYKRFIITRPVVDVGTSKSLTPEELGDLYYKIASAYLEDILEGLMDREEITRLLQEGKVMVTDVSYLRGRTFDDSLIFLDDAQNTQPENAAEILMRIGRNSRLIIAGDPVLQKPLGAEKDGATLLREVLLNEENAVVVDLGLKDIVRPGAKRGVKVSFELRMRKRELSNMERQMLDLVRVHAPDADVVTVIEFKQEKENLGIKSESVPDALIIAKEGHLGRVVGKGGERIKAIEGESNLRVRTVEMNLNFKEWIRALHPIGWIGKHIVDVDFAGPELMIIVRKSAFGAFVGQRGIYARLIDRVFKRLINVGIRAMENEE